jgi:hypothetical protein
VYILTYPKYDYILTFTLAVAEAHHSARVASLRPPNVPSEEQQARAISMLDEAQFRVIKAINDAEGVLSCTSIYILSWINGVS